MGSLKICFYFMFMGKYKVFSWSKYYFWKLDFSLETNLKTCTEFEKQNFILTGCSLITSRKFGLFLNLLPPLSHSYALALMYLCHKKTNPNSHPPLYVTSFMNDPLCHYHPKRGYNFTFRQSLTIFVHCSGYTKNNQKIP